MSGDPYNYKDAVDQIIPFDIDSDNFIYIKRIELFAKNFIYQDNTKPADIFISNLRFQVAYRIPDEEFAGTALSILTPEGNYFTAAEGLISKSAIAQLRIKGKVTESITNQIKYYWFIEDLRISKSSDVGYHKYGGRGWRCLNQYNVTEGTEEDPITVDYVSGEDLFMIKKDNSLSKETKYKCVINYNNQILEKEFYFINYDITNEVIIIADRNPNFIDSIGATTLTCSATNAVSYQWAKIDAEGGFEALKDTIAENNEYENAVSEYNKLQVAIKNKTEPDNEANQKLLALHESVIQKYNNTERRKENQIINLQAGSIFQEATYKCQAFDKNGNSLGIGAQLVTNYLSAGEDLQTGSLVINNGGQVFKYNAKGIAPTSEQFDEPQIILPLGFTLRNAQGIEIPMDALRDTDITWIVPIKNTMIKNYVGSVLSHDEELGIEVYNGKSLGYNINENYYANKDNNEIELRVKYQELVYIAKTNLYFTKDGDNGTNGTDYVLKILPSTDTIGRLKVVKAGQTGNDWLRIQLWYNGIKIYEGTKSDDGSKVSTGKKLDLTWEMIGEKKNTPHNITVKNNGTNPPSWTAASTYNSTATDIVKAVVEYDGMRIVATAPIIYSANWNNTNYKVSLKEGTGFTHVVYSQDGLTPNYDSHTPFEISVQKLINGQWGDLTGHSSLTYSWSVIGNLKIKSGYTNTAAAVMFEPVGKYNSEETNNAVVCTIKEGSTTIGTLHIPIHFLLNTYGNAALNEWDGNSIKLDADGNTMLLAPQGGFGKKEADNSYTGVLLGTTKDYTNGGLEHTGIFGYNAGTRTMFLNSENGAAIFGSTGSSQIMIDPTAKYIDGKNGVALLYSNDFYKNYDTKTGLPTSYNSGNENGQGALIDLTTPQIRWGNGNFKVDKNGHITAKGGGTIAGWNIDDTALFTGTKDSSSNVQIASSNFKRTINGTSREDWRMAFSNNFGVSSGGIMHAASGIIGSGTNKITLGKSSGDEARSALYSGSKSKFDANASGFYLGTDGIALGSHNGSNSAFQVNSSGQMIARSGYIGNGISGWTIGNSNLYNTKNALNHNSNGVFIGTNGIGLGQLTDYKDITGASSTDNHSKFEVTSSGTLYANGGYFRGKINANGGYIAGWKINSSTITGGNITLNSNGSLSGGDSSHQWSIATNGYATFNGITANSATVTGKVTANEGKIGNWSISNGAISNGNVTLTSDGKIIANSGSIGGWNVDSVQFQKQIGQYTFEIRSDRPTDQPALLVYKNQGDGQGYKFYVRPDGFLYAQNAEIHGAITATSGTFTGTINATSGTFQNCTVTDSCSVPASTITGTLSSERIPTLSANKISGGTLTINTTGGGEFSVGVNGRTNAYATGLTTGSNGIAMNGSDGISGCVGASNSSGGAAYTCAGDMSIRGDNNLYLRGGGSANNILIYTTSGWKSLGVLIDELSKNNTSGANTTGRLRIQTGTGQSATFKLSHGLLLSASGDTGVDASGFWND